MFPRLLLVLVLAVVVGFGVGKVFEQGRPAQQASQSGTHLDAALSAESAPATSERWYDNATTIGLMAGGAVFVVGVVIVAALKPPDPRAPDRRS